MKYAIAERWRVREPKAPFEVNRFSHEFTRAFQFGRGDAAVFPSLDVWPLSGARTVFGGGRAMPIQRRCG